MFLHVLSSMLLCVFPPQESHRSIVEKVPIGDGSYKHRRDIVFSQAVTTVVTCVVFKMLQSLVNKLFVAQLVEVGFLCHWESLLSTIGGEYGMLEDFIVAIHDLNNVKLKVREREREKRNVIYVQYVVNVPCLENIC